MAAVAAVEALAGMALAVEALAGMAGAVEALAGTQLENAYKAPNLASAAKVALDDAKTKAVSAMKKDDDATCHKAISEALPKAGMTLK